MFFGGFYVLKSLQKAPFGVSREIKTTSLRDIYVYSCVEGGGPDEIGFLDQVLHVGYNVARD